MDEIATSISDRIPTASHEISPSSNLHDSRLEAHSPTSTLLSNSSAEKTIFYLAYGSNLAAATFQGRRGIKPLRAINVAVPSLRLTFDLPGLPYTEPCFANTALRHPPSDPRLPTTLSEKAHIFPHAPTSPDPVSNAKDPYHKNRWTKPLVGVVYELTPADYAHVIATEGGGASYHDVVIPCFTLASDPSAPVPDDPEADGIPPFSAHTLFAPAHTPGSSRPSRPDPSYAQPSARYLNLLTSGAAEHNLPVEYRTYLLQIRSYTITSTAQRLGQFIFAATWGPVVMAMFALAPLFQDKHGRSPKWFARATGAVFTAMWRSYDGVFKSVFGDGERTVYKPDSEQRQTEGVLVDLEKGDATPEPDEQAKA